MNGSVLVERMRADALEADSLRARSRELLVSAIRAGAREGLSQREIAAAVGRSQPEVLRLLRFAPATALGRRVADQRRDVLALARRHGVTNVRVFGSVAAGADGPASDIDLLVDIRETTSLLDLSRLEVELSTLLGVEVDVVPSRSLRPHLAARVLGEAVPL